MALMAHIDNFEDACDDQAWLMAVMMALVAAVHVQVAGEKSPLLFGGMTDALIASMKQSISDMCFSVA